MLCPSVHGEIRLLEETMSPPTNVALMPNSFICWTIANALGQAAHIKGTGVERLDMQRCGEILVSRVICWEEIGFDAKRICSRLKFVRYPRPLT